jgi:hypothetical protein
VEGVEWSRETRERERTLREPAIVAVVSLVVLLAGKGTLLLLEGSRLDLAGRGLDDGGDDGEVGELDIARVGVVTERASGRGIVRNNGDSKGQPGADEDEVGSEGHCVDDVREVVRGLGVSEQALLFCEEREGKRATMLGLKLVELFR